MSISRQVLAITAASAATAMSSVSNDVVEAIFLETIGSKNWASQIPVGGRSDESLH